MYRNERMFNMLIILRQVLIKNLFSRLGVYSIQAFRGIFPFTHANDEYEIRRVSERLPVYSCYVYLRSAKLQKHDGTARYSPKTVRLMYSTSIWESSG